MNVRVRLLPLRAGSLGIALAGILLATGCRLSRSETPTSIGLNIRDVVEPQGQADANEQLRRLDITTTAMEVAQRQRARAAADPILASRRQKNVLCLSGGGSYGAFSAGLLSGWTKTGMRPEFDVVTGISIGSLLAPFAFLGSQADAEMEQFFTQLDKRDVYRLRPVRGLFTTALADNSPLARKVDGFVTPELIAAIACEHRKGRRLYMGTTELEGRRFVIWNIGAIACRSDERDRELIVQIMLGSSAIPGFFPPAEIAVTVDGRRLVEKHGDGGTSQSIFFRPPYLPSTSGTQQQSYELAGTNVWCVVAGKLYADPEPLKARSLTVAESSVSTILYAQCRGDLQRIYTFCLLTGMHYFQTAIPADFPAPKSSTDFERQSLRKMFDEGVRLARCGTAWRMTPPGTEPGEAPLERTGTNLTTLPAPR